MKQLVTIALVATICACASNPDKIDATYVSPLKYKDYDCEQIGQEMEYVSQRTNKLYQELKAKRTADNWQMGIGLIIFWPTLFLLEGGDGPEAVEYAQLKGDFEALRSSSVQRKCGLEAKSPEQIMKEADEAAKARQKES